jgi:hypothetical protein
VHSWLILALFVFACCRVLVLDQGLLIETGEPHELLLSCGMICAHTGLSVRPFYSACCRVLVLDQGLLIENGEPHELLQKEAGIFSGMVEQTGSSSSAYLRDVAREASYTRAAAHSVASGTALHLHRLREQQDSMVIGRPAPAGLAGEAVSEEESEGEQQHGGDGAAGAGRFNRNRSELGLNRYAAQVGGGWSYGCVDMDMLYRKRGMERGGRGVVSSSDKRCFRGGERRGAAAWW